MMSQVGCDLQFRWQMAHSAITGKQNEQIRIWSIENTVCMYTCLSLCLYVCIQCTCVCTDLCINALIRHHTYVWGIEMECNHSCYLSIQVGSRRFSDLRCFDVFKHLRTTLALTLAFQMIACRSDLLPTFQFTTVVNSLCWLDEKNDVNLNLW